MGIRGYVYGKTKGVPNTFIGGVASSISTKEALATQLGISASTITYFKVVGLDVEAGINSSYTMKNSAFSGNTSITYFDDAEGKVTSLGVADTFYNCTELLYLRFPNATYAGYRAMKGCTKLTDIYFDSLTTVSSEFLQNCSSLVNYHNSFSKVTAGTNLMLSGCSSIVELYFPVMGYSDMNNATNMFANMTSLTTLYAPNLTFSTANTSVGGGLCLGCANLVNVTLTSLNRLPSSAFSGCTSLVTLDLPSVTSAVLSNAFYNTTNLKTLNIPNLTTTLSSTYRAFYYSGIEVVDFSKITSMTNFSNDTWEGCNSLITIDLRSVQKSAGNIGSSSAKNNVFRYVPTTATVIFHQSQFNEEIDAMDGDVFDLTTTNPSVQFVGLDESVSDGLQLAYSTHEIVNGTPYSAQIREIGGSTLDVGFSGGIIDTSTITSFANGSPATFSTLYEQIDQKYNLNLATQEPLATDNNFEGLDYINDDTESSGLYGRYNPKINLAGDYIVNYVFRNEQSTINNRSNIIIHTMHPGLKGNFTLMIYKSGLNYYVAVKYKPSSMFSTIADVYYIIPIDDSEIRFTLFTFSYINGVFRFYRNGSVQTESGSGTTVPRALYGIYLGVGYGNLLSSGHITEVKTVTFYSGQDLSSFDIDTDMSDFMAIHGIT